MLLAGSARGETAGVPAKPLGDNPYALKPPHFKPRAKAVISLFMSGGPSAVDLFDYKEGLVKYAGQPLDDKIHGDVIVRQGNPGPLMPSPFKFSRYGQSGKLVSEVFPNIAKHVDDLAFVHSVFGRSNDHVQAHYEMQSGRSAWVPERRLVGHVRPRFGEHQPAGVRRDLRPARRPDRRTDQLERGLHAGRVSGHALPRAGDPIVDLKPVAGMTPESSAIGSICCRS